MRPLLFWNDNAHALAARRRDLIMVYMQMLPSLRFSCLARQGLALDKRSNLTELMLFPDSLPASSALGNP